MDGNRIRETLERQAGVVARHQLLECGAGDGDIRRWVRRRHLVRVFEGVYVNHTGPLSWVSRTWAAVLVYAPAALTHDSVVHRAGDVVHIALAPERRVVRRPRIVVHHLTGLDERVQWHAGPPRVRLEDALLMMCSSRSRVDALALVGDVCHRRRTTPERLLTELSRHPNLRNRSWLRDVLVETAAGVRSPLESSYLRKIERAHRLPRGVRQLREDTDDGRVYRDVGYERFGLVVELDGRLGHELLRDRWDDMDRDLLVMLDGRRTVRLGWRHTENQPCRTAARLAVLLSQGGWRGTLRPCGPACDAGTPRITVTR